jgi:putative DNA primase/helicase
VTTRLIDSVRQALTDLTLLGVEDCPKQPQWIGGGGPWPIDEVIPTPQGIVHLPTWADDGDCLVPPTPRLFCPYATSYRWERLPAPPSAWLAFLGDLWRDDPESIALLQEWFGYLLTPDTSQQKILMLVGPRRSGKGTIARVLTALLGEQNVCNPTLSSLGTPFGLAPLLGKRAAIITDARISGRSDLAAVVERLLSISGEDSQTVDRKHRDAVDGGLFARFSIISNELPRIRDQSSALSGRMVFLQFTRSFYDCEDTRLMRKLLPELPGILRWAAEGWKRLRDRGRFVQPEAAQDLVATMEDLASPMSAFLRDHVMVGPKGEVAIANLYLDWRNWCSAQGVNEPGDQETFGRNLRAAVPGVERRRRRINGHLTWIYRGVRLLKEGEFNRVPEDEEDEEDEAVLVPF